MFVELVLWLVPTRLKDSSLNLLRLQQHDMSSSGGLICSLAGHELYCQDNLVSVTFWKSWEDLARFLASPKAGILAEKSRRQQIESPKPHHFEVVWDYPADEVDTISGPAFWAMHDFAAHDDKLNTLMAGLRHTVCDLSHQAGFRSGGLWIDKSNGHHVIVATQWSSDAPPSQQVVDLMLKSGVPSATESSARLFAVTQTDPYHASVI